MPAPLERLREAVHAVREHTVHAACELRLPSVHGRHLYVTALDLSLLRLPRLGRAPTVPSRPRSDRPSDTSSSVSTSYARAGSRSATTSGLERPPPRAGRRGRHVKWAARACWAAMAGTSRPFWPRAGRRTARTSSSRLWTPSGIPLMLLKRWAWFDLRSCTSRSAFPSASSAALPVACGSSMRLRSARACPSSRTASTRRTRCGTGWDATTRQPRSSSYRSASTPRGSVPRAAIGRTTSSRSAPTRTATSRCCSRRRAHARAFVPHRHDGEHLGALATIPGNVVLETNLPFGEMRRRLAGARVVALPGAGEQLLGRDDRASAGDGVRRSRSVVTRTQAIAAATASSTARTAGSCLRETGMPSSGPPEVLRDGERA